MIEKTIYLYKEAASQKGFTLIEVMVALVIFSIGFLGLIGLQLAGSKLVSDSYYRTIAVVQANDMIDRMRANANETQRGITSAYNNDSVGTQNINCSGTSGCTSAQMAKQDLYEWEQSLASQLPSGKGIVCIDSSPIDGNDPTSFACSNTVTTAASPIFAIKIYWKEKKNSTTYHRYINSFSL